MLRVEGKIALITGAARGMGRSLAVRLAEEGADVVAVDICHDVATAHTGLARSADMDETVRLVEATGRRILARAADVRDQGEMNLAVAAGLEAFGSVDIVCANAAITSFGRTWEIDEAAWQDVIEVNLTGSWHTVKAALPGMIEGGRGGSIVFVNSVNGLKSGAGIGHYAASKHGVVGLMRTLAVELGPYGIRVNSVHPTMVTTPMAVNPASLARYFPDQPDAGIDDLAERMRGRHALPVPWVEAVDIANAALWLSSDEARYVTGVALPVDAGMLVR
jgi:SDR family mycofactocin-dependent oxidoreductase